MAARRKAQRYDTEKFTTPGSVPAFLEVTHEELSLIFREEGPEDEVHEGRQARGSHGAFNSGSSPLAMWRRSARERWAASRPAGVSS